MFGLNKKSEVRTVSISSPKFSFGLRKDKGELFDEIEGYDELKKVFARMLGLHGESTHALLLGPPASGKTLFGLSMKKHLSALFLSGENSTGPGVIDTLFMNPKTRLVFIDEIEKMPKRDQECFLNLMENGILSSNKVRLNKSIKMEGIKIFATANDLDRMSKPLFSRFMKFYLPEYTEEEFYRIARTLLQKRYKRSDEVCDRIATIVWQEMETKDIRDVLAIGKISKTIEEVEETAAAFAKYCPSNMNQVQEYE